MLAFLRQPTAMTSFRRVLILDDVAQTRQWLADIVAEAFPEAVVAFADGVRQAVEHLNAAVFDLALVDLGLGDGSGTEVLSHCRGMAQSPVCVVTTIFDDDRHLFEALRAGAQGYLLKDRSPAELTAALAGIASGQPPLSPSIARRMLAHFAPVPEECVPLTPRERDVLLLVAKGYTVAETARSLELRPSTVSGYVKQVYRKLQVSNRAEAALEAQRQGLV